MGQAYFTSGFDSILDQKHIQTDKHESILVKDASENGLVETTKDLLPEHLSWSKGQSKLKKKVNNGIVSDLNEKTYVPSIGDLFKQRQDNFRKAKALAKSDKPKIDVKKVKDDSVKCSLDQDPDETRAPFFEVDSSEDKVNEIIIPVQTKVKIHPGLENQEIMVPVQT